MERPGAVFIILAGGIMAALVAGLLFSGTGHSCPAAEPPAAPPHLVDPAGNGTAMQGGRLTLPVLPRFYRDTVPEGTGHQWVNLSWADPEKPRTLLVYSPEETLGPYSNSFNGRTNQRISLYMEQDTGLPAGPWYYEVQAGNGTMNNAQSLEIVREPAAGVTEGV